MSKVKDSQSLYYFLYVIVVLMVDWIMSCSPGSVLLIIPIQCFVVFCNDREPFMVFAFLDGSNCFLGEVYWEVVDFARVFLVQVSKYDLHIFQVTLIF